MQDFLLDNLLLLKSLHLVGMVGWFGGLFYLVRIFVYHVEALDKPTAEANILTAQYQIMEQRVYKIICNPGMIITWVFGLLMLHAYGLEWLKTQHWMHAKLAFVVILSGYLGYCKTVMKRLAKGEKVLTSFKFRLFNEIPSILLLAIILLAVYRNSLNYGKAIIGVLVFGIIIFAITKAYKKARNKA